MRPRELWILDDGRIMGGGQHFALRLARYVRTERGAGSVRIVSPAGCALAEAARSHGIDVTPMDFPSPAALPLIALRAVALRHKLRGHDALVVAGSARCQAVAAAARAETPLVHLMHEQESASRPSVRMIHRRVGRVVAVGAQAAQAYGASALRNFLLSEDFDRLQALRPPPGDGTLGVLARLIPEKGVLELVSERADASGWSRLLVAGPAQNASYAAQVRAAADDRVDLLGEVPGPAELLGRVDALIVPSVGHEGQPTVILEALAAARPVVVRTRILSSDFAGLPVFGYGDLSDALRQARAAAPADGRLVRERFGPRQALEAIESESG